MSHADESVPHTSLDKRDVVLGIVSGCLHDIRTVVDGGAVRRRVAAAVTQALSVQGTPAERPYLARTVCQIVHGVRRGGWVDIARETIEQAIGLGARDAYLYSELAECHLARGDHRGAELVMERARAAGVGAAAISTSLIRFWGRSGHLADAVRVFATARQHDELTEYTHAALISAHAQAGDVDGARGAFARADEAGACSAAAFKSMAFALSRQGNLEALDALLQRASERGCASAHLTSTAIRSQLAARRIGRARAILLEARTAGAVDATCYVDIVMAYFGSGRNRDARRLVKLAIDDAALSEADKRTVKAANRSQGSPMRLRVLTRRLKSRPDMSACA